MSRFQIAFFLSIVFNSLYSQELIETVPFELQHDLMFIKVTINDSDKPLNFLLDTGAGVTVIDSKPSQELALRITDTAKINTSGKPIISKESKPNTLKIGQKLILENISLIVMDLSHISNYFKQKVDGVIGYDLLHKVITETNMDRQEVLFFHPEHFEYQGTGIPVTIIPLESNLFGISVEVQPDRRNESQTMNLQIDTGADNTLTFHNDVVEELQLIPTTKKLKWRQGFGADSTLTKNLKSKVYLVNFGHKQWKNIAVMLEVNPINSRRNSLANGLIGMGLLKDFNITYDLYRQLIYLEKRN